MTGPRLPPACRPARSCPRQIALASRPGTTAVQNIRPLGDDMLPILQHLGYRRQAWAALGCPPEDQRHRNQLDRASPVSDAIADPDDPGGRPARERTIDRPPSVTYRG